MERDHGFWSKTSEVTGVSKVEYYVQWMILNEHWKPKTEITQIEIDESLTSNTFKVKHPAADSTKKGF